MLISWFIFLLITILKLFFLYPQCFTYSKKAGGFDLFVCYEFCRAWDSAWSTETSSVFLNKQVKGNAGLYLNQTLYQKSK